MSKYYGDPLSNMYGYYSANGTLTGTITGTTIASAPGAGKRIVIHGWFFRNLGGGEASYSIKSNNTVMFKDTMQDNGSDAFAQFELRLNENEAFKLAAPAGDYFFKWGISG